MVVPPFQLATYTPAIPSQPRPEGGSCRNYEILISEPEIKNKGAPGKRVWGDDAGRVRSQVDTTGKHIRGTI